MTKKLCRLALAACLLAFLAQGDALAQSKPSGLFGLLAPSSTTAENGADLETHPPLRLTPDKSELIRLNENAASIIVGNPVHLNVLLDSARLLVVVPRVPGATHFTVLNNDGQVIMQRHVIVASPKEKYIRLRKTCALASGDCAETAVYYCPDMCHEIQLSTDESTAQPAAAEGEEEDEETN